MNSKKLPGVCRLTGMSGPYVDSHIIPRALTRLSKTGEKYVEARIGHGIKKCANSWYDGKLVTRVGEDILSDIDSKAINELRRHRLVWSGWGTDDRLGPEEVASTAGHSTHRLIAFERPEVLRIFFLSLLWRAAASTRPEFDEIILTDCDLEDLRLRVLNQNPGQPQDYPIQLFQLITRGPAHNRTPLLERKPIINIDCSEGPEISYVRFYFDGLVGHVHLARQHELDAEFLKTCLGFDDATIVFTHEFDKSRTMENIKEMVARVECQRYSLDRRLNPISVAVKACWPVSGDIHLAVTTIAAPQTFTKSE